MLTLACFVVAAAAAASPPVNSYEGSNNAGGNLFFASPASWSLRAFPTWPQTARVATHATLQVQTTAKTAGKVLLIEGID